MLTRFLLAIGVAACALRAAVACGDHPRFLAAQGSPQAIGLALGTCEAESIRSVFALRQQFHRAHGTYELWNTVARTTEAAMAAHTPVAYAELQGMAGAAGLSLDALMLLAVDYDVSMEARPTTTVGHCTGFVSNGTTAGPAPLLFGQNNDETPELWLNATLDKVYALRASPGSAVPSALVYTHPGYSAYMGMNDAGVGVLWQYVDNGERALLHGVPTTPLLRELLTFTSVHDAVAYLRRTPRMIPNNFVLVEANRFCNVEMTPAHFTSVCQARGYLAHANHFVFDQELVDTDVGSSVTTRARFALMRQMLKDFGGKVDMARGRALLSAPPVFNNHTLASMVFDAEARSMSIRFKGEGEWHEFSL